MIVLNINKKVLKVTIQTLVNISFRYYPGGIPSGFARKYLSLETSNRILRVFNKDNILTNNFSNAEFNIFANNIYQTHKDRASFFYNLRNIASNGQTTSVITSNNDHLIINRLAQLVRLSNPASRIPSLSAQQINKESSLIQPSRSLSLDEKKAAFFEKHNDIMNQMKIVIKFYEKNKQIDWVFIQKMDEYFKNRSIIIPNYTIEENQAIVFLRKVFNENTETQEVILSHLKDKLHELKMQSNLPNNDLFDKIQEKCFTQEDYINKIKAIKEAIKLLQTNNILLSKENLILLSIYSGAVILDEENNPKLTREIYTLMNQFPEKFQIKYTDQKPNYHEIIDALKNKHYFIKQSSNELREGHIISTAPLLHKTIIIPTKQGYYYGGMLTSSKTDTELLSKTQECNLDPEGRNKEQRFVVFSHFIVCNDKEITIDLLALGFINAKNLEGEDVHQKVIQFFEDKKDIWANNFVQELTIINNEVLRNISVMFHEKNLKIVQEDYRRFCNVLANLSEQQKSERFQILKEQKENEIELLNEQKYFSKLSENFQKLFLLLKNFEKETKHQKTLSIQQERKAQINKEIEEAKVKLKQIQESRQRTGQLTITERREALQKKIKQEAEAKLITQIEEKNRHEENF